jgi:CheY-like chemotaxis protein
MQTAAPIAENQMHTMRPSALVVDDEPLISMFLADRLEDMGFEVTTAGSAEEALTSVQSKSAFTVAFIDLGLPGRSGLEFIAELKALHPQTPVVIASGYGLMAARDVDDNNRAPAVLAKPYDGKKVLKVLTELGISVPHVPEDDYLDE